MQTDHRSSESSTALLSAPPMDPAVFLDRDNTLIVNDGDLGDPADVRLVDGVADGLRRLRDAGYRLVVVTNQGGVARGRFTEQDVDAVHQRIAELVDASLGLHGVIDRFYYCPYHPDGAVEEYRREHPWRKPNPGMLLQAAHDMGLDLSDSWMVGDQPRDVDAGRGAGCRTVLLTAGDVADGATEPTMRAPSFDGAVSAILEGRHPSIDEPAPDAVDPDDHDRPVAPTADSGTAPPTARPPSTGGAANERAPLDVTVAPRRLRSAPTETGPSGDPRELRQTLKELADQIRTDRERRMEFSPLLMAAALAQLVALLLATLGLLQSSQFEPFLMWLGGAVFVQLLTMTLLLVDARR